MNVGLSPQHGLCQLFRPHPTSRNSLIIYAMLSDVNPHYLYLSKFVLKRQIKQQHSCYTHTMLGRNLNNDVFIIPRIQHFNVFQSKHLTSTSDISQNSQRVTVVTDNFITLFYGLVLRRSFIHSPVHHQLIVTRLTRT